MKARFRTEGYELCFEGAPALWNEFLRPMFGGPEAPDEPEQTEETAPPVAHAQQPRASSPMQPGPLRPATPSLVRAPGPTNEPPLRRPRGDEWRPQPQRSERSRPQQPPQRRAGPHGGGAPPPGKPARREKPKPAAPRVAGSTDATTLYAQLAELPGRRSEKDAVLAAVWFVTKAKRPASAEEIERHLREHPAFAGIKVRPHLQKHVNRSKTLDAGDLPGTFALNKKGANYVLDHLIDPR